MDSKESKFNASGWKAPETSEERTDVFDELTRLTYNRGEVWDALTALRTHVDDYNKWRDVGFALGNTDPELRDLYHAWSSLSEKYDSDRCDQIFNAAKGNYEGKKLTLGSLFYWAKQAKHQTQRIKQPKFQIHSLDELLSGNFSVTY